DDEGKRIELERAPSLPKTFLRPGHVGKVIAIPMVSGGGVRIQLDGAAEFLFSASPIPFEVLFHQSERGVRLRKRVVDFQGLHGGSLCLWPGFRGGDVSSIA